MPGAEFDDLDQATLKDFLAQRVGAADLSAERLMTGLGLVAQIGSKLAPTAAGLLCFGRYPQLLRPEWGVAAVRIAGRKLSDQLSAKEELSGTLPEQLTRALAFVEEHTGGLEDEAGRQAEYPRAAVREALVNAMVHRDYRLTGRVALRIYDDRLEVYSPGGPITPIDVEQAASLGGVSFARNPMLMAVARHLQLAEQLGRGLPTIYAALESNGQRPSLATSNNDVLLTLPSRLTELVNHAAVN